jgi:hypothetical protein
LAHAQLSPATIVGYFGENVHYPRSFLLLGGPGGLALTGAASLARNATKKAAAERVATPRWHNLGGKAGSEPRPAAYGDRRTGNLFNWLMNGDSTTLGVPASSIAG